RGVPAGDVVVGNVRVGHGGSWLGWRDGRGCGRWENIRHDSDSIADHDGDASYATCCLGQRARRISRPLRSRLARRPSPPVRIRFMYSGGPEATLARFSTPARAARPGNVPARRASTSLSATAFAVNSASSAVEPVAVIFTTRFVTPVASTLLRRVFSDNPEPSLCIAPLRTRSLFAIASCALRFLTPGCCCSTTSALLASMAGLISASIMPMLMPTAAATQTMILCRLTARRNLRRAIAGLLIAGPRTPSPARAIAPDSDDDNDDRCWLAGFGWHC